MHHTKHFTLEEAQLSLDKLKPILKRIIDLKKAADEKGYDIHKYQFFGGISTNGSGKYPKEIEELIKNVSDLSNRGILLKSMDDGLIDFPYLRNDGSEVYLCFIYGEETVGYWHGIEDGFAGRKSIDEL